MTIYDPPSNRTNITVNNDAPTSLAITVTLNFVSFVS
jgi:hypothetical protein